MPVGLGEMTASAPQKIWQLKQIFALRKSGFKRPSKSDAPFHQTAFLRLGLQQPSAVKRLASHDFDAESGKTLVLMNG
jgi:hypothetical protein